jgi:hypothetical protein
MQESYKWLEELLKKEIPNCRVCYNDQDYGAFMSMAVAVGEKGDPDHRQIAFVVESNRWVTPEGEDAVWTEYTDNERKHEDWDGHDGYYANPGALRSEHYSLNDDPDKEAAIAFLIASLRKALLG